MSGFFDTDNLELSRTAVLPNGVRLAGGVGSSDQLVCRANILRNPHNRKNADKPTPKISGGQSDCLQTVDCAPARCILLLGLKQLLTAYVSIRPVQ
jgi:hypothetical protein